MTQHFASLAEVRAAQRRARRKSHTPRRWREDPDERWSRQRAEREELARFRRARAIAWPSTDIEPSGRSGSALVGGDWYPEDWISGGNQARTSWRELQQEEYDRMWPEIEDPMAVGEVLGL